MFADAVEAILVDRCTPTVVRAIEGGDDPAPLAAAIEDAGFHALMVPESEGGAGAGWAELHAVVSLCGAYAVPLPLAQTIAVRALVRTPASLPAGLITFAPALVREAGGSWRADLVPEGRVASHVVGASGGALVVLPTAQGRPASSGVHNSLAASFRWEKGTIVASDVTPDRFLAIAALLHAGRLAGAMKRVFDLTMTYANHRVQFGKPIGKFQAIQQQLSVMAEHVAAASLAAEAAFRNGRGDLPAIGACAVAKARASEAAQLVASIAHGVHGAIGVTAEYDLQLFTRRLHAWRLEHGSELHWNRRIGRLCLDRGDALVADFARSLL